MKFFGDKIMPASAMILTFRTSCNKGDYANDFICTGYMPAFFCLHKR